MFLLLSFLTLIIRLYINFRIPLVPGINGGYGIVQVREIMETGRLALPDMPFFFYLSALFVKAFSFLLPGQEVKDLIMIVMKVLDSAILPVLVWPVYLIQRDIFKTSYRIWFLTALAGYAVLSFSPFILISDATKNSAGLFFMTFMFYFFFKYLKFSSKNDGIISALFLILTGLTHFGTLTISLCAVIIGLIVFYRKKAIIGVFGVIILAFLIVFIFDKNRAISLLSAWEDMFTVFISPRLAYYPEGIFNYLSSFVIIWLAIKTNRNHKSEMGSFDSKILLMLVVFIAILSFPFYHFEFGRRFGLMLFVPQSVVLLLIYKYTSSRINNFIVIILTTVVIISVAQCLISPKPALITDEAFNDLKYVKKFINKEGQVIVFARHGLEWWVAWEMQVHIAGSHIVADQEMQMNYNHIYYLVQKEGENVLYPGGNSLFKKPVPPENTKLVYSSDYFNLHELVFERS